MQMHIKQTMLIRQGSQQVGAYYKDHVDKTRQLNVDAYQTDHIDQTRQLNVDAYQTDYVDLTSQLVGRCILERAC